LYVRDLRSGRHRVNDARRGSARPRPRPRSGARVRVHRGTRGEWELTPATKEWWCSPGAARGEVVIRSRATVPVVRAGGARASRPAYTAKYLQKTECFCFTPQDFGPAQQREFTVRFIVDPDCRRSGPMTLAYRCTRCGAQARGTLRSRPGGRHARGRRYAPEREERSSPSPKHTPRRQRQVLTSRTTPTPAVGPRRCSSGCSAPPRC